MRVLRAYLSGWINVNGHPDTWSVRDNMIITTGLPVGFLRTDRMYENFVLDFEWMHIPPRPDAVGNSGLFVWADPVPAIGQGSFARAIEVQVLVNLEKKDAYTSHGDIFSIWGAKCVGETKPIAVSSGNRSRDTIQRSQISSRRELIGDIT